MSSRNIKKKKQAKRKRRKRFIRFIMTLMVIFAALIGIVLFIKRDNIMRMKYSIEYDEYVQKYAKKYDLDPLFLHAVIYVESDHKADAVSHRGAIGLMQIMDETGYWISENLDMEDFDSEMLYDPETNIAMGTWLLDYLIEEYNENEDTALAAYNGGIGNVNEWLESNEYSSDGISLDHIPFKETEEYVVRINKAYERYKQLY